MENKITKEKILIITTILVVSIVFIGIGYAFFTANNPEGSTAQIISKSGRMLINYNDGTDNIMPVTNIQPSNAILVNKTFSLTGTNTTSDLDMPFTISLEYQNMFKYAELIYFLKRVDDSENVVADIVDVLEINGPLTLEILEQLDIGLPQDLVGYYLGIIEDWSNNPCSQEIASGYFKANSENETVTFNLKMMFRDTGNNQDYNKGATFNGKIVVTAPEINTFATDTWEEIANNVKSGNASRYSVGSEKEVEIGGKSYTLRVSNNTTPTECNDSNFSQTACGFVVEFADIVENRKMNSTGTNAGGWRDSEMRTYANGAFFNKLPEDLRNVITDTKVVSGHGSTTGETNFTTTDKIYLLSAHEVWENKVIFNGNEIDTAYSQTRQLDYYAEKGVTTKNPSGAIKKYNNSNCDWWLRAAYSNSDSYFLDVVYDGTWVNSIANNSFGFAPAFRIG